MVSNKDTAAQQSEAFLKEAYDLNSEHRTISFYAKWAKDYDKQMAQLGYLSPQLISEKLIANLSDKNSRILDVGCGTGLTAVNLTNHGYNNLHGVDISAEMIEVARSRDIYAALQTADINQSLNYQTEFFDGIISSGTFTHGHVGSEPLDELSRILKPKGIIACTVHTALWQEMGFEKKFVELEDAGILKKIELTMDQYFEFGEREGWFCLYEKT